jgi:DNA-binding HxlR family transcriptional regulator
VKSLPLPVGDELDQEACIKSQVILEAIGRRWTGGVLLAGYRGATRFGDYRRMVPGVSDRLLSQRLKELEHMGLIEREVIPTTPVQILYHPTKEGAGLMSALQPLIAWGTRHFILDE